MVYGGLNTLVSGAVLAGIIRPEGGYDAIAMVGHAWLWDPLFFVWGVWRWSYGFGTPAGVRRNLRGPRWMHQFMTIGGEARNRPASKCLPCVVGIDAVTPSCTDATPESIAPATVLASRFRSHLRNFVSPCGMTSETALKFLVAPLPDDCPVDAMPEPYELPGAAFIVSYVGGGCFW